MIPEPPNVPPIICEAPLNVIVPLGPNCVALAPEAIAMIPVSEPNEIRVSFVLAFDTIAGANT